MRVGYEAKRAFLNSTGLGNYSRGLIRMMALNYPQNEYFLYTPKIKPNKAFEFLSAIKQVETKTPKSGYFTSLWRSRGVVFDLKRDHIELYHGLSHELPIGISDSGIKSVVTIHDLIFMRYPQYFGLVSRKIYAAKIRYACKHADRIIAVSEKTKADLVQLMNVHPEMIEVLYQGCDESFYARQDEAKLAEVRSTYKLPERYILNVGTIEPRKNLLLLAKALLYLPRDTQLVVVGKKAKYFELVNKYVVEHKLAAQVLFLDKVAFADLPAIYQQAQLFVYPSRYEGFGIPVLEALVSGVPVVAAKGSCLEEAGGPDSLYCDPDDETDLTEKIRQVLDNASLQQKMIEKGLAYSRRFDEQKLAAQLMNIYNNVLHA
ncbi:mannosyltransferase [Mucilaginibacter sp. PPCGB 2223]|uniref:glycosyltransferase family 4 protein n=1 Tax=Mucilaginibacter sp. PPCGB 2223 TaxID=1886027 RepID=UPI0008241E5D|nr:glycosyltransferase family 1 protein [Mucilaginibacter sp. PPCGB 2223]OCX54534.1 mannosyltransferase [Mucilaginibacter sp. PPCGB 2223]